MKEKANHSILFLFVIAVLIQIKKNEENNINYH